MVCDSGHDRKRSDHAGADRTSSAKSSIWRLLLYKKRTDLVPGRREDLPCGNDVSGIFVCNGGRSKGTVLEPERDSRTYETSAGRGRNISGRVAGGAGISGRPD